MLLSVARSKRLPVFLDDHEPELLLAAATRQRDRLILLTILMCGLRNAELRKLRIEHLDFRTRRLWVREGKGKRDRVCPVPKRLAGPLRGWIGGRQAGFVFPSPRCRDGERTMTARALQLLLKRLAVKAKLRDALAPRRVRPHALRHAFASRLLDSGANLHDGRDLLGHSNVATTNTYAHTSPKRLAEVIDRVYE